MGTINTISNFYKILKIIHSDKDAIDEIQQRHLRKLLSHAANKSEFYNDLYKGIDLENCSLQDLPIVTKTTMMDNYDSFVTDKRLKLHEIQNWLENKQNAGKFYLGEFSPFLTSGSTGQNAMITYHKKAVETFQTNFFAIYPFQSKRSIQGHIQKITGYLFGKRPRIAVMSLPNGNVAQFCKRAPVFHSLFTKMRIFSYMDPLDKIVGELNKFKPDQLVSVTFFIALLAQEQLADRLKISFDHPLSFIIGSGELLTEHTRELASQAWGMKIHDHYATAECYHMATSCSMYGHLHQMSHLCVIEIVDRNYKPTPQGQYGEKILLTNLINFTQPIIRYEIDDVIGYANQSCQCGSPYPTLLPLQGRTKEFLYFKCPQGDYDKLPPTVLHVTLYNLNEIRQYQIVQTARNELTVIYVLGNKSSNIEQKLKQTLTAALSQRSLENHVILKLKQVESISRHERSGKYKSIISLGPPRNLDA